ncbi:anaphase-promoting complex component apc8 [Hamiltosporidium tvaerminnensis]|nr:anaphase-promoting complex component apc8 [Hamiltosporidium tvaerminnensis]
MLEQKPLQQTLIDLYKRSLNNSIQFITKIGFSTPITISYTDKEIYCKSLFEVKEYRKLYGFLLCIESKKYPEEIIFCNCCTPIYNYYRNISLYKDRERQGLKSFIVHNTPPPTDSYLLYIHALCTNKQKHKEKILCRCININPYFWDPYLLLLYSDISLLEIPHTPIFHIFVLYSYTHSINPSNLLKNSIKFLISSLQLILSINPSQENNNFEIKNKFDINTSEINFNFNEMKYLEENSLEIIDNNKIYSNEEMINYNKETNYNKTYSTEKLEKSNESININNYNTIPFKIALLAATFYYLKEFDKSILLFNFIQNNFPLNLDFYDLFSNILYIKNDIKQLASLTTKCVELNPERPETMCVIANYYSLKGNHENAIEYFKKAITFSPTFTSVYTLIGHEYMELKEYNMAIYSYNKALKYNKTDYRAWYGLGKVYLSLSLKEYSSYFYIKASELKPDDSYIWLCLGQVKLLCNSIEESVSCFLKATTLGDIDGYLMIADLYKNEKRYYEAVIYYEKYVDESKERKEDIYKICVFLCEYYNEIGNIKKVEFYTKMMDEYEGRS